LKGIFQSDFYSECADGPGFPFQNASKAWRFWMPLMCLFMGMRPREVCQMHTSDLRRTAAGTWYVDVVACGEDEDPPAQGTVKSLKTKTSRRRIPLHPELSAIGFVEFVAQQKKLSSDARLFPDLKGNKYGDPAQYPLKRFNETYLPEVANLKAGQSFYSFRHTFRDELRRVGAPPDALQALGGWSQGKLISDDYGDKSNPDYMVQYMQAIEFPGLELSYLYTNGTAE
jgi:integrase